MKTRFTWLGIVATITIGISSTFFVGCNEDINAVVRYVGKVIYAGTNNPFPNLEVKVTNGEKIHCIEYTSSSGEFVLNVKVGDIDDRYYVLVGDASCVTKRIALSGFGQEEVDLGTIEIEGPSLPVITTKTITNITDNKATSGGNVSSDGRSPVTARGVCWSKSEYPTIDDEHTENGSGTGEFKSQLTDLEAGVIYNVRAYAVNKQGIAYGKQISFTTATGLPEVTTSEVTNITISTASCGGNVDANSGYAITSRGICWSSNTATPTINNNHTEEVPATGKFTSLMVGLERNTTYYVRAYAINEKGIGYGNTVQFTTISGLPSVTTNDVGENITDSTAISGGEVTNDGGFPITERGVCWSIYQYPTIDDNKTINGKGVGQFSSVITGIDWDSHEQYYIRAYATNEIGTVYGEQVTITKDRYLYTKLPIFIYNGYTYRLSDDMGVANWENAWNVCLDLEFGGYDDWILPTRDELKYIMTEQKNQNKYDGWKQSDGTEFESSGDVESASYWTRTYSTEEGDGKHYALNYYFGYGAPSSHIETWLVDNSSTLRFRAVRKYK